MIQAEYASSVTEGCRRVTAPIGGKKDFRGMELKTVSVKDESASVCAGIAVRTN